MRHNGYVRDSLRRIDVTHHSRKDALTLLLVRHGRCRDSQSGLIARRSSPLSEEGRDTMAGLARTWTDGPPRRLFASDLQRARESAQLLATGWGVQVEIDERLAEASLGEWEGRSWPDVERQDADAFQRWGREWTTAAPPGGESLSAVCSRVKAWTEQVCGRTEPGSRIVAVTHGGVIRAALIALVGLTPAAAFRFAVDCGSVTPLVVGRNDGETWCEVEYLNGRTFGC